MSVLICTVSVRPAKSEDTRAVTRFTSFVVFVPSRVDIAVVTRLSTDPTIRLTVRRRHGVSRPRIQLATVRRRCLVRVLLLSVPSRVRTRRVVLLPLRHVENVVVSPDALPRLLGASVSNRLDRKKFLNSRPVSAFIRRTRLGASLRLLKTFEKLGAGVPVTTLSKLTLPLMLERLTLSLDKLTLERLTLLVVFESVGALNENVSPSVVLLMSNTSFRLMFRPVLFRSLLKDPFAKILALGRVSRLRITRELVVCLTSR